MSSWDKMLQDAEPGGHLVQLYKSDEGLLAKNVASYIRGGLEAQANLLVIATGEHSHEFSARLQEQEIDVHAAERQGRIFFHDADEMIEKSMYSGRPDWDRFDGVIGKTLRQNADGPGKTTLRVYDEMVDVLWRAGQFSTALQLERFWNRLAATRPVNLFCTYPIDVFDSEFRIDALDEILCAHTHLLPTGTNGDLEIAVNRAMDEILGPRVDNLRLLIKSNYRPSWAVLPKAEAIVLWLRNNLPDDAEAILARARQHYRPCYALGATIEDPED